MLIEYANFMSVEAIETTNLFDAVLKQGSGHGKSFLYLVASGSGSFA
jgi:hypothetical protein